MVAGSPRTTSDEDSGEEGEEAQDVVQELPSTSVDRMEYVQGPLEAWDQVLVESCEEEES